MTDTQILQDHLAGRHADEPNDDCRACRARPLVLPDGPQPVRLDKPALPSGRTCECECGETVGPKARFRPGHDAKLKSRLVDLARAGDADAISRLTSLGWAKFI
jgi:hypothetical protein